MIKLKNIIHESVVHQSDECNVYKLNSSKEFDMHTKGLFGKFEDYITPIFLIEAKEGNKMKFTYLLSNDEGEDSDNYAQDDDEYTLPTAYNIENEQIPLEVVLATYPDLNFKNVIGIDYQLSNYDTFFYSPWTPYILLRNMRNELAEITEIEGEPNDDTESGVQIKPNENIYSDVKIAGSEQTFESKSFYEMPDLILNVMIGNKRHTITYEPNMKMLQLQSKGKLLFQKKNSLKKFSIENVIDMYVNALVLLVHNIKSNDNPTISVN